MTNPNCDICQGTGRVNLHVYPKPEPYKFKDTDQSVEHLVSVLRDYPCPECGEYTPTERIGIVWADISYPIDVTIGTEYYQELRNNLIRTSAYRVADELIKEGYFTVEDMSETDTDLLYGRRSLRVKLGVVPREVTHTAEQLAIKFCIPIAQKVAHAAVAKIQNWCADYGDVPLGRGDACKRVMEAMREVIADASKKIGHGQKS